MMLTHIWHDIFQFCFVARKKFNQVSFLHVVHHGIMPLSVWPGARYVPGGHASFFGLLNTFVHIVMYFYYMMSAMGPQYQKYLWWKQHLTTLQMIQFVGIMVHGFQLVFYDDCDFPWQFSYYIGAHAILFFVLFSQFYIVNYLKKSPSSSAAIKVIMLENVFFPISCLLLKKVWHEIWESLCTNWFF